MEPTTFSALKAMERLGYIARRQVGDDRKKVYVFLTPEGPRAQARAGAARRGGERRSRRAGVRKADIAATRAVLLAIIENLAREDAAQDKRMPSTRALARLGERRKRARAKPPSGRLIAASGFVRAFGITSGRA